jgi:uncharacterized repeat protein (TIGR01451 family)
VNESGPYRTGQVIHYENWVRNMGGSAGQPTVVQMSNRLPPGVAFRSATANGVACTASLPDVTCEHAVVFGELLIVRIEVQLPDRPGNLTNQVHVDPQNRVRESNENNNRDQVTIRVE